VDSIIAEMERTMRDLESQRAEAERAREDAERLRQQQESAIKQIEEKRLEVLRKAKDEADSMLAQARGDIAVIIKRLREGSRLQRSVIDDEARKAREALKDVSDRALSIEEGITR